MDSVYQQMLLFGTQFDSYLLNSKDSIKTNNSACRMQIMQMEQIYPSQVRYYYVTFMLFVVCKIMHLTKLPLCHLL